MRKTFICLLLFITGVALAACGSTSASEEGKEITIGATAGPYSDQLQEGIIPILEEEGYSIDVVEFNDYIQPNNALNEGEIDANLYQNRNYLNNFNADHGMDLVVPFAVPTAPIALYSERHTSLEDVEAGMKVTLPNDPVNLARSLHMLEDYGWISIHEEADPITASENDIEENHLDLQVEPIDPAQTPRSLGDTDFAFVNGNFALASGLKLEEAVDVEKTSEDFLIYLTVRKEDENEDFVEALRKAYESEKFLKYTNEHLQGYVKPPYQVEVEESTE
ncbi:MetQ/NlpA family ABC transporter substrate-binding protein [Virgibacillus kimchii]